MGFNQETRQVFQQQPPLVFSAGNTSTMQLPQTGYLSKIILPFEVVFTTAHTGTYANKLGPVPTPYDFVKRLRLYTNDGTTLFDVSGWGTYLINRTMRTATDLRNLLTSFDSTGKQALISNVPSSYAIDTQYTIRFDLVIPVAWGEALTFGMILLQSPGLHVNLDVQWGVGSDLLTLGGTTPAITVNSVNCTPMLEIFTVPAAPESQPNMSLVHVWNEEQQPIVAPGDIHFKPLQGPVYMNIIQEFVNNNARVAASSIQTLSLLLAQLQTAYNFTGRHAYLLEALRLGGMTLPDGITWWNWTFGSGILEAGNTRDVIATASTLEVDLRTTIDPTLTITAPAYVRSIKEMLLPIAR